jgi:hypothetical protein
MTEMPEPQQIPPAFTQNGHSPSQMALAAMQRMPQMLAEALASVLQQVPVQGTRYRCTQCVMNRIAWVGSHEKAADQAQAMYERAAEVYAGLDPGDPRRPPVPPSFTMFLPDNLRPGGAQGMPPIVEGTAMMNGSVYCMEHIPGAPGKSGLLLANAAGMITGMTQF